MFLSGRVNNSMIHWIIIWSSSLKLSVQNKHFTVAEMSQASNAGLFSKHMWSCFQMTSVGGLEIPNQTILRSVVIQQLTETVQLGSRAPKHKLCLSEDYLLRNSLRPYVTPLPGQQINPSCRQNFESVTLVWGFSTCNEYGVISY